MLPEGNQLPKLFIQFESLAEYEANKARLAPNQIAFVKTSETTGKIFLNGIDYTGT